MLPHKSSPHTIDGEIASLEATLQTFYAEYGPDQATYNVDVRKEYDAVRNRLADCQEFRAAPADAWFLGRPVGS